MPWKIDNLAPIRQISSNVRCKLGSSSILLIYKHRTTRKIAVIFIADVVGYSKQMERDENATLKAYAEYERILKICLKKYKGTIFNTPGNTVLVELFNVISNQRLSSHII